MLKALLLIVVSIAGLGVCIIYLRKNLVRIAEKNKTLNSTGKKMLNYPLTILWYGYLIAFFIGLTVNNLILT